MISLTNVGWGPTRSCIFENAFVLCSDVNVVFAGIILVDYSFLSPLLIPSFENETLESNLIFVPFHIIKWQSLNLSNQLLKNKRSYPVSHFTKDFKDVVN